MTRDLASLMSFPQLACVFMGCISNLCGAAIRISSRICSFPASGATSPFARNFQNCCTHIVGSAPTIPEPDFFSPAAIRWFDSVLYILSFSRLGEMQHKASVWPPHHLLLKNSVPLASKRATLVSVCQRVDSKSVMWHKGGSADQVCVCGCVCVF